MHRLCQIVDLVLELLHVSMCLVILGGVLVVALVEFLVELVLGKFDLLINLLDDLVHVLALAHLT